MIKSSKHISPTLGDFLMNPGNLDTRKKDFFIKVDRFLDWEPVIKAIENLYEKGNGRPGFAALMMFKALLLAQWYGLSDPELEDQLKDRLSFKQFVGLGITDDVPDETTLCRFRERLNKENLMEKLFVLINGQLEEKGLFVKKGTLIDASIIEAEGKGNAKTRDPEASFTKKNNKSYFGYKLHAGMDMESGLIHHLEATTASTHDSRVWDELLNGKEKALFADKAYYDQGYKHFLRSRDIYCGILDKKKRNHSLSKKQIRRNKRNASLRAPVERFFAVIKDQYHTLKTRYRGLSRNRQHFFALGSAFNLQLGIRLAGT